MRERGGKPSPKKGKRGRSALYRRAYLSAGVCNAVGRPLPLSVPLRISEELLPTPAKSHYTFNLRDLSKVFQGTLMIQPGNCQSKDVMVRLWIHESCR